MYLTKFTPTCIGDLVDVVKTSRVFIKSENFIGVDCVIGSFKQCVTFTGLNENWALTVDAATFNLRKSYFRLNQNFDAIELPKIILQLMKG